MNDELKVLRISGKSPTKETAGSIVKTYDSGFKNIELRAIGASSVSQMAKSIATASSIFASKGLSLTARLGYDKVTLDGDKTVIIARLIIQ